VRFASQIADEEFRRTPAMGKIRVLRPPEIRAPSSFDPRLLIGTEYTETP
jgi:hypothetical protein